MNKKRPATAIGSTAQVGFPDLGIQEVPAKIDTGADSSAIWATNVNIVDGKLSCYFFAPRSAYYRNNVFTTKVFKRAMVKNSFGHKEFRYKVKLKVRIGPRTVSTWFTLANRSRNKYPILIGKNTLKSRFIVDVSQRNSFSNLSSTDKVLIMCNKPQLFSNFFKELGIYHKRPTVYDCLSYDVLLFDINSGNSKVIDIMSKKDLAEYSFIHFKLHAKNPEFSATLAEYLRFKSRPFSDGEVVHYTSASKLSEYMKLTCRGLPIPRAICAKPDKLIKQYKEIKNSFGLPFVVKEISSNKGRNNYLVNSHRAYIDILSSGAPGHIYLSQKYIENDGYYRAYVFGNEIALSFRRTVSPGTEKAIMHLNKPTGGTNAYLVQSEQLPAEVQDLAVRAAACMNRQVAGVDILQDKRTNEWYILEVNNAPELRKGLFVEEKAKAFAKFIDKELNR